MHSNESGVNLTLATREDAKEILALYQSMIGTEFCVWTDTYPSMNEIEFDLNRDALYIYKENGKVVSAISIDLDENVEKLPCWSDTLRPAVEFSRLAVLKDYQNRGIAREMILKLMAVCKEKGSKSVHYLVAKENKKAIRSYEKLNFNNVGETILWGHEYFCYEKAL